MNEKIEMLNREVERWAIICDLQKSIATCNEDADKDCDVCVGMQFAIDIIKRRLENE